MLFALAIILFIIFLLVLAWLVLILLSLGPLGFMISFILLVAVIIKAKAIFLLIYMGLERISKPPTYHQLEGKIGIAKTDINEKGGWVLVEGELWEARSLHGRIPKGSEVIVVKKEQTFLIVERYIQGYEPISSQRKIEF